MKLNLNKIAKKVLTDKYVLYIVAFLSIFNLLSYVMVSNFDAIILFVILGFLSSYFSKNMIIVLLIPLVATNLFVMFRRNKYREGLENKIKSENENENENKNENENENKNENENENKNENENENENKLMESTNVKNENEMNNENINTEHITGENDKDKQMKIEEAYNNIDELLKSGNLEHMSNDTKKLAERQNKLMSQIEQMQPMIQKAGEIMKHMDMSKIENMIGGIGGLVNKLSGK